MTNSTKLDEQLDFLQTAVLYADGDENVLTNQRQMVEQAIEAYIAEQKKKIEQAYGGCHKCYGKGYSTVRRGRSYRKNGVYATHEINEEMNYCTCDRGKQLASLLKSNERVS